MMEQPEANAAVALPCCRRADRRREGGALALIAAAMTCQDILRGVMAPAKVDDMLSVPSVAAAVLLDDQYGGLFNLLAPAGSA